MPKSEDFSNFFFLSSHAIRQRCQLKLIWILHLMQQHLPFLFFKIDDSSHSLYKKSLLVTFGSKIELLSAVHRCTMPHKIRRYIVLHSTWKRADTFGCWGNHWFVIGTKWLSKRYSGNRCRNLFPFLQSWVGKKNAIWRYLHAFFYA